MILGEWESAQAPVTELSDPDRELVTALAAADGGRVIVDERRTGVWVSAKSWVGVVRFSEFDLQIVPKLAGGNFGLVQMLDYVSGIRALKKYDTKRLLETTGGDLLELVAWLFADACDRLVSDGLLSDYVTRDETLHVLRGRLRVLPHLQRQFGRVDPLEVTYDEFETEIPENQVVAATLEATRGVVRTPFLQRRIKRLHSIFNEAADPAGMDPRVALTEIAYTRRNEHYKDAHELARLLLSRVAVRNLFSSGATTSFAFLLDMNELFEGFAARLATDTLTPLGITVHSQRRDPSIIIDEKTGKRYSTIIPDLLLERRSGGTAVRLPVDAKYKLYDAKKLDEGDVYQTFFYAYAYAPRRISGAQARAAILYPRAGDGEDAALRVHSHTGEQSARIEALGIDVPDALRAVEENRVQLDTVPAMWRLARIFAETARAVEGAPRWVA